MIAPHRLKMSEGALPGYRRLSSLKMTPATMKGRGLPAAKSRVRLRLDCTPNAAASVLPSTCHRVRRAGVPGRSPDVSPPRRSPRARARPAPPRLRRGGRPYFCSAFGAPPRARSCRAGTGDRGRLARAGRRARSSCDTAARSIGAVALCCTAMTIWWSPPCPFPTRSA